MTLNYHKNINLVRLAGINRFVVMELKPNHTRVFLVKNNNPVYNILGSHGLEKYTVEKSIDVPGADNDSLRSELTKFCKDNLLENCYAVCDTNRYRVKTVKIPRDTETEEWLDQNKKSFLPEGATPDQFIFSNKELFRDEDFIYLLVCLSRCDYTELLSETLRQAGLIPLAIFPFILPLQVKKEINESPRLVLELWENFLLYSYSDEKFNLTSGQFQLTENFNERVDQIINSINKLGLDFNLRKESGKKIPVEVMLIASKDDYGILRNIIEQEYFSVFNDSTQKIKDTHSIIPLSAAENLVSDFNNAINLLDDKTLLTEREKIEKNFMTRITLACGVLMFVLLALISVGEIFLADNIQKSNELLVDYEAKQNIIQTKISENNKLKNDLVALKDLKSGETLYPEILRIISEITGENCYLSNLRMTKKTDSKIFLEIEGAASGQKYITNILTNLELNKKFSDVSLINSVIMNSDRIKYNPGLSGSELMTFKISADYNVD